MTKAACGVAFTNVWVKANISRENTLHILTFKALKHTQWLAPAGSPSPAGRHLSFIHGLNLSTKLSLLVLKTFLLYWYGKNVLKYENKSLEQGRNGWTRETTMIITTVQEIRPNKLCLLWTKHHWVLSLSASYHRLPWSTCAQTVPITWLEISDDGFAMNTCDPSIP